MLIGNNIALIVFFAAKSSYSAILEYYFNKYYDGDYKILYGHQSLIFYISPKLWRGNLWLIFTNEKRFINMEILKALNYGKNTKNCLRTISTDNFEKWDFSFYENMAKISFESMLKILNFGHESIIDINKEGISQSNREENEAILNKIREFTNKFERASPTHTNNERSTEIKSTAASTNWVKPDSRMYDECYKQFLRKVLKKHKAGAVPYTSFVRDTSNLFSKYFFSCNTYF